jgi:hypothetical protein
MPHYSPALTCQSGVLPVEQKNILRIVVASPGERPDEDKQSQQRIKPEELLQRQRPRRHRGDLWRHSLQDKKRR